MRPRIPPGVIAAAVLALTAIVAIGARDTSLFAPLRDGYPDRGELLRYIGMITAAGAVVVVVSAVISRRSLPWTVPLTAAAVAIGSLYVITRTELDGDAPTPQRPPRLPRPPEIDLPEGDAPKIEGPQVNAGGAGLGPLAQILLLLAAIVLAALVALSLWTLWTNRTRRADKEDDEDDEDAMEQDEEPAGLDDPRDVMARTLSRSIDEMLADADPRTAIIGAYARMLEGLDACGMGRQPQEGPMEHIRRALMQLQIRPDPVRRLTELFAIARFSTHALTEAHRADALDALRAAVSDLGVTGPVGAPA